jgi:predicted ATPase/class 3 adenylate cyclase
MPALPSGLVTFMFTDVEGSTRLHQLLGAQFGTLIAAHDALLTEAIEAHHGVVVKSLGDGLFAAFRTNFDALAAAVEIEGAVGSRHWPADATVRVRIGLHAGEAEPHGNDYVALAVHQAARVCAAAHGGQVLLTDAVLPVDRVGLDTIDLGAHRLKDFLQPVVLHQLGSGRFPPLRTMSVANLPRPASSFVGRHAEVAHVATLVQDRSRLVTLTGPGGVGKTRLAIEAGTELAPRFPAGVVWVDLKQLDDATQVLAGIAAALGAPADLEAHIGDRELLVLLDNVEQVISAAPALASLVEACPNLRLLLTSRERLQVRGELAHAVVPLDDADAVTLFCERAGVEPSEDVRRLCAALDRLPLGIELAAARARVLSVRQIVERLGTRLDSLKGGRDADPRQHTLRATIGWSFELLDADERRLFARLAVFTGGCSLEAAEEIADADLDVLQSLVVKSLLQRTGGRFEYLQTIRDYASERLAESGEEDELRRRHATWFVDLVRTAQLHLHTSGQETWLELLRAETDNIRAVLDLALRQPVPNAFDVANALGAPWRTWGHLPALVAWYRQALAGAPDLDPTTRAATLEAYGSGLLFLNELRDAEAALRESVALYRELGDALGTAAAQNTLGNIAWINGDTEQAIALRSAALETFRSHGDQRGVARSLHLLGEDLRDDGHREQAVAALEEAIAIDRERGDQQGVMTSVHSLGDLWLDASDPRRARQCFRDALAISHRLGDELSQSYCLAGLAGAAALERDPFTAGRLWGAAEAIEARLGQPMLAKERERYERLLAPLAQDVVFRAAAEDGRRAPGARVVQPWLTG